MWVLRRRYAVAVNDDGGDFAGGVIAHAGARLGREVVASFDRRAVKLRTGHGRIARPLAG